MASAPSGSEQLGVLVQGTTHLHTSEELARKLERSRSEGRPLRVKLGIDPTAPDIHLGHTVVLRKLRQFQDFGHTVVLILGDATAAIGDPTGRSATRPLLAPEVIRRNAETYQDQAFRVLDRDRCEIRWNGEWLSKLTFSDFVRIASRLTVARLIERDDFAKRLKSGTPIGVHELLYPLSQAHDSVVVKADVELGGTDQLFNLLVGRDLQRAEGMEPQVVLTVPILAGLDGVQRMSKSLGNYVGVAEPPSEMFGKLMSIPDAQIGPYIRLLTPSKPGVAEEWESRMRSGELNPRDAKAEMAREIVKQFHGAQAAVQASAAFDRTFKDRQEPIEMPEVAIGASELGSDGRIGVVKLLQLAGCAASNREARRLIEQGGVMLNSVPIRDPNGTWQVVPGEVLQVGPRRFFRLARF